MCGPTVTPFLLRAIRALLNLVLALIKALLRLVFALICILAKICNIILLGCGEHEVHEPDLNDL